MKKSDLITHVCLATLGFMAMIPSIMHHGTSLNSSVFGWGALANVGLACALYTLVGAKT